MSAIDKNLTKAQEKEVIVMAEKAVSDMKKVRKNVGQVIFGQETVVDNTLTTILAGGHALLVGLPGLAKTKLVETLGTVLGLDDSRIQFTPDLMPSDILGSEILHQDEKGKRSFQFIKGPVFAQLLMADEINRASPRTQAALLQSMQEYHVTIAGQRYDLPSPFHVLATQNPLEQEGTYPLPEAQLDRFLIKLNVGYPERDEEQMVLARHNEGISLHDVQAMGVQAVTNPAELDAARAQVRAVTVEESILSYITDIVRATRSSPVVDLGVSPRGGVAILGLSKAWAWMAGRPYVTPDDVKVITKPALRHRLHIQPEAELEGVTPDSVLEQLLDSVPVPR